MRFLPVIAALLAVGGCTTVPEPQASSGDSRLIAAEKLIDAFYSFDPKPLRLALVDAPASQPRILYYQGWAEGGNYAVIGRQQCEFVNHDEAVCAITVRDDLIAALGTGFWVTDSFHLTFQDGRIVKVSTSSNDPPDFGAGLAWLQAERPEIMSGPCLGFFDGGPSPGDCVRAVVRGFREYRAARRSE